MMDHPPRQEPGAGSGSGGATRPIGEPPGSPPGAPPWPGPADAPPGSQTAPPWPGPADAPPGSQTAPLPQWGGQQPPAAPKRRNTVLWVVLGVAVLAVLLGGIYAITTVGGKVARASKPLKTPADVAGLRRIDSPAFRGLLDQQEKQLRDKGVKNFVVAAYGTETQPEFVLVAVREASDRTRGDIVKGFDQALGQATPGSGATDQTFKRGDVEYRCTASQLGGNFSICRWNDGDMVGFGFSLTSRPERLSDLTAEARNEMR